MSTLNSIAERFFHLAEVAANHGGFWVSDGGEAANVAARVIADKTGASFDEAYDALVEVGTVWAEDCMGGWYMRLERIRSIWHEDYPYKFDVRVVAKTACRS